MGWVLDVGCGCGRVLLMLSGQIGEGIGIDINGPAPQYTLRSLPG